MKKNLKIILLATLSIIIAPSLLESRTYGYSKADCPKHGKDWRNGKCRDKVKTVDLATASVEIEPFVLANIQTADLAAISMQTQSSLLANASDNHVTVQFYDKNQKEIASPTLVWRDDSITIPSNAAFINATYVAYDGNDNVPYTIINMQKIHSKNSYSITNPFCNCNPDGSNAATCRTCACNETGNEKGFNQGCKDPKNPEGYWTLTVINTSISSI